MNTVSFKNTEFTPSKIVCIGRNYVDHIKELSNEMPEELVVFNKPNSAISNSLISFHQEPIHYEGEICFIIEKGEFTGVGFGLDLTKRALQSKLKTKGLPWERAKAFNGSALFSHFVSLDKVTSPLLLRLEINDELIQHGGEALMMVKPSDILSELKTFLTLEDGDIVMTGTPKGVGMVNAGDTFRGSIWQENEKLVEVSWRAE